MMTIFFFLEFHELLKILHLTLFHHKDSDSFKNVMFFAGFVLFVVINVLFSQPWVSVTYFFLLKILSHIDIGVCLKLQLRRIQKPLKHLR